MFRLRSKIVLAFSIIILTGSILMVTIINYTTRVGYEDFAKKSDVVYAKRLTQPLEEYYSKNGTWKGVEDFFQFPKTRMNEIMESRGRNMVPLIVLTDNRGNVIINTQKLDRKKISKDLLDNGIPLINENSTVGYLFTGSMIVKKLNSEEQKFLDNIRFIIIIVTLFILIISIIFSYIFSYKLTKPISVLSKASKEIESGNYKIRVDVNGVDEISKLSESFNNMAKSIDNSDIWRKQIIADSAHELRTPVTLIQGNLEMIIDGVYKADKKNIKNIFNETQVLARLINELQELSSAESGSMYTKKEDINLNILTKDIIETFNLGKIKEGIELKNNIITELPFIEGDEQKLKQVFSNILNNTYRFTPRGGKIDITANVLNDKIIVEIHDTGSGIAKTDLEKIFERFYRTDSSRNRESGGRGIGLAISRSIIELHNGTIYAKSEINFGTTIIVTLPIKK